MAARGRLALRVRAGRRSARLGSRRFRPLAAGRSVVLSFRMGSAARRLARRRRAALVGSVSAADRAGNRRTDRVKLKLR